MVSLDEVVRTYNVPIRGSSFSASAGAGASQDLGTLSVKYYSLQVVGVGASPTAWDVRLEGSLDNVNFSTLIQHLTTDLDKTIKSNTSPIPIIYLRVNTVSLTLGSATGINIYFLCSQ